MHHSGPLPLAFEGPEQGFGGKVCQNGSWGKTLMALNTYSINPNKGPCSNTPPPVIFFFQNFTLTCINSCTIFRIISRIISGIAIFSTFIVCILTV